MTNRGLTITILCASVGTVACSSQEKPSGGGGATQTMPETAGGVVEAARSQFRIAPPPRPKKVFRLDPRSPRFTPESMEAARQVVTPGLASRFEPAGERFTAVFNSQALAKPIAAKVAYARTADSPFRISAEQTAVAIEVRLRGASRARAEQGQGYVVYRGGHSSGGDILHRATPDGTEDFVTLPRAGTGALTYDVDLEPGVAGLRLVANTLEFLDGKGAPRLRVDPPVAIDARGKLVEAALSVSGCAYDRSPAAPWGRPVTAPGASRCAVTASLPANQALAFPVLFDPSWTATTNMPTGAGNIGRMAHISAQVGNSLVLIAGGTRNGTTLTNTALLYNHASGPPSYSATGSMITARYSAQAFVTGTTVIVASGSIDINTLQTTATADVYVISGAGAGTWALSAGSNMNTSRTGAVVHVFDDGKALIAGGANVDNMGAQTILKSTEIYDPSDESFSTNGAWDMSSFRFGHAVSRRSGTVALVTGGTTDPSAVQSLSTAETFDENTLLWTNRTAMSEGHVYHSQVTLANGKILVAGGMKVLTGSLLSSATVELFDGNNGVNGAWAAQTSLLAARDGHKALLFGNGAVVIAGGRTNSTALDTSEVFDPAATATGTWTSGGVASVTRDSGFTLVGPLTGEVGVLIGGDNGTFTPQRNVDVYTLTAGGSACSINSDCGTGFCVDGVCCDTACGGGSTTDCQACSIAAGATVDGTCAARPNLATCRASAGACDVAETCNGVLTTCPADTVLTVGTTCRAAAGTCDQAETCDGTLGTCPADTKKVGVCRPLSGACDRPEFCDGVVDNCPNDGHAPVGTVCRGSFGPCDAEETCNGTTNTCPDDGFLPATTVCRAAAGACDQAETCTGTGITCPADVKSTAVCRPSAGACDAPESCDGIASTCPADTMAVSGTVCRVAAGACDLAETCTGTSSTCPGDLKSTAVCQTTVGLCEQARSCSGLANECPSAPVAAAVGTACGTSGGTCDASRGCLVSKAFMSGSTMNQVYINGGLTVTVGPGTVGTVNGMPVTAISLTERVDAPPHGAGLPEGGAVTPLYQLGPSGAIFTGGTVTVSLKVNLPDGEAVVIAHCPDGGGACELKTVTVSGGSITVTVGHFSTIFGALETGSPDAGAPDAGADASTPADAADGSTSADAAVRSDAVADVATPSDAVASDGTIAPMTDAGLASDATAPTSDAAIVRNDAAPAPSGDATVATDDAGVKKTSDSGCSCRVGGQSSNAGGFASLLLVAIGASLLRRRRR
jgi:MYXO-CTERM domain-containing protein